MNEATQVFRRIDYCFGIEALVLDRFFKEFYWMLLIKHFHCMKCSVIQTFWYTYESWTQTRKQDFMNIWKYSLPHFSSCDGNRRDDCSLWLSFSLYMNISSFYQNIQVFSSSELSDFKVLLLQFKFIRTVKNYFLSVCIKW